MDRHVRLDPTVGQTAWIGMLCFIDSSRLVLHFSGLNLNYDFFLLSGDTFTDCFAPKHSCCLYSLCKYISTVANMARNGCSLRDSEIDREFVVSSDDSSDLSSVSDINSDCGDILLNDVEGNSDGESDSVDDPEPAAGNETARRRAQTTVRTPPPWSRTINYIEPSPIYSEYGPCHSLLTGSDCLDYFSLLLGGDSFFENIAKFTNENAAEKQRITNKPDRHWTPVSVEEIKAFIGVEIYMGIYDLPQIDDYFIGDFIKCPIVQQSMTLRRYKKINQYLCISDPTHIQRPGSDNYDILYKVRPVLKIIDTFRDFFKPGKDISVDEAMIGFKGRFCLKQYMPKKPTKWGIKIWASACSKSGYFLFGKVYLGKKEERNNTLLLGEQVVMDVVEPYLYKNHHIYYDNFFTSFQLANLLLQRDTYSCGTVRVNRFGWPAEFKKPKTLKLNRGDSASMQSGQVVATVWRDNREVSFLSTNANPNVISQIDRKTGKGNETIQIDCPQVVSQYTKNMGGVDRADQFRSYYSFGRPSKKWWKYLFHFVINTAIVNSFIIYKLTNLPSINKHGSTQLQFRKSLTEQLIGNFSSRKRLGRKRSLPVGIISPKSQHVLEKRSYTTVCVVCRENGRKTKSGNAIRSYFICKQCDTSFCKHPCFLTYHQSKGVEISQ